MTAQAAHAGLNGDTITGSLTANANNWGVITQQFNPTTAVVGGGVEFSGQYGNGVYYTPSMWWNIGVDVADTSFTITANALPGGYNNIYAYTSPLFTVHLGNLNAGTPITGVTLLSGLASISGYATWDVVTTSHTADSIDVTFYNLPSSLNGSGSWTFGIQPVATVPEASTYGMMLVGLGLVGFAVRRRTQTRA